GYHRVYRRDHSGLRGCSATVRRKPVWGLLRDAAKLDGKIELQLAAGELTVKQLARSDFDDELRLVEIAGQFQRWRGFRAERRTTPEQQRPPGGICAVELQCQ